ncbi:hypothetical protein OG558_08430 [Kribbella sp. NBC_01510]|uniref:hypothetical protein n=1 Tax=Kribbella sp. NBC_01510 TaxID=2903581 RepID=UPI003863D925
MDAADEIWNRAAINGGGLDPSLGDLALTSALRLHNLAMSGGLLDAVERMTPEQLEAAQSGYHWLRLDSAADVVAMVQQEMNAGALDDDDRAEDLEVRADDEYGRAIPGDQTLVDAFRTRLDEDPDAFTPV